MSGYLDFERTGNDAFDAVLEAIENAGTAYHHTSEWAEGGFMHDENEPTQLELINEKIAEARTLLEASPPTDTITITKAEYDALVKLENTMRIIATQPEHPNVPHKYLAQRAIEQHDSAKGK